MTKGANRACVWLFLSFATFLLVPLSTASAEVAPFEVSEYMHDFDVPREVAEENLAVQHRGVKIVDELKAALGEDYAGVWFDTDAGEFAVPVLPGVSRATTDVLMDAGIAGDASRLSSVATSSWQELQAAQGKIDAELRGFFEDDLVQTSLDPRTNAVVVHVASAAHEQDRTDLMRIAEGAGVQVELRESDADRFQGWLAACSDIVPNCGRPFRGGVEIGYHNQPGGECTAGFAARGDTDGKKYVITAGHCAAGKNPSDPVIHWDAWDEQKLPYVGEAHYLGSVEQIIFPGHDWMKINANGSWWDIAGWGGRIAYWGPSHVEPHPDVEYPINGEASSYMNQTVCHSGIASGGSCGVVKDLEVSEEFNDKYWLHDLVKVKGACSEGGDSGGPWFAANMALGIHSGSDSIFGCGGAYAYYTEIAQATDAMGVSILAEPPPPGQKPTVNTGDAPEVRDTEALITGTVDPHGLATTFRFEYGMTTSYGKSIPVPDETAGSGNGPVVVSKTIQGLEARSHYHYRLVATNALGTTYGSDRTFTTGVKWLLRNSNSGGGAEDTAWLGLPGWIPVSGDWNGDGVDTPGAFNPVSGMWRLSNSLSKSGKVDLEFQYGGPGAKPIVGNWDGIGADGIGVYYPDGPGFWHLRECVCGGNPDYAFDFGGGLWTNPVAGDWDGDGIDTIGAYEPKAGNWNMRDSNSSGGADHAFQYGGGVFERSVAGDWDGDGIDTIGVYDPQAGNWTMRNTNTTGGPDIAFQFGGSKFGTVVGDWDGNGTSTVALTDADATVQRNWLLRNSNTGGGADLGYFFGDPDQIGVVGDWNGDGFKTLGTFDPASGTWRLTNSNSNPQPEIEFQYGASGSKPVVGNWDGIGADGIGVYYPDGIGIWHLRECICGGNPDYAFDYGGGPWKNPVAGDWNGDGVDTIGVFDPQAGNWNLRNQNSSGGPNYSFGFGGGLWNTSLVGDWNGDGVDTIGVYEPQAGNWNMRDSNSGGGANHAFQFGGPQFQPIVGDWDGNGTVTVGLIANNGEVLTPPRPPVVTTQAPTAVSEGKATLKGTVNPNGFTTRYRFEWGATTSYGNAIPVSYEKAGMGTSPVAVSANISGLLGGTTYHYRLVAESAEGKRVGDDKAFQTPPGDGTTERLAEMAVTQPFNGSALSVANFNSNWGKLGWAAGKGEDLASGWRPVSSYPTVQGAFSNLKFSDEKGVATAATMAANPGSAGRYLSLWLDMGSASGGSRSGYELRFTYVSANTYTVNLSKWSSGTQTVLASKTNVTFANGNSLALVDKGSAVSGWVNASSGYTELFSAADSTFSSGNAGVEGAGNSTRLTSFKVGSLLPNTTSEPGTSTTWNLRYSNTTGGPDLSVLFGVAGQKEVIGDWNGDGISTFGNFDASTGTWKLRNSNGPGPAEIVFKFGGGSFNTPVVGDWNGDGIDTVGVFDLNNGNWSLRYSNLEGAADQAFQYGGPGSKPIAGNWDGIGADGIGVYYASGGDWNLRECVCGGNPNYAFQYGGGVWSKPIAGNWDGIGADGIGVYDPQAGNWSLRHCMCGGNPDYSFQYGGGAWATPVVGDWKGNGIDTIGVAND